MLTFFLIALATALTALLLGLALRAKLGGDEVWEELVGPAASSDQELLDELREFDSRSRPQPEELNRPAPKPASRSPQDADLRRSSRVERSVPLLILCTNRHGETFQEQTSAVAVNLHGCRYPSRHEYLPESWVTLQVTGTDGANSPVVRARVRSVLSTKSRREPCQVGIELETPGNVWGIPAPPEDWQQILGAGDPGARAEAAAAPAPGLEPPLSALFASQPGLPERKAEVTVFPGSAPSAHPTGPGPAIGSTPAKAARVVVVADQLLQTLEGRIRLAADRAVQTALSAELDQAVKSALAKIEDAWSAQVRQTEERSAARLVELQELWGKELIGYLNRAEEISRHLEAQAVRSQSAPADPQNSQPSCPEQTASQLPVRLNELVGIENSERQATGEAPEQPSLRSTTGGVSQEQVEELVRIGQEQTLSCLEARFGELGARFEATEELARRRSEELAGRLESLAAETTHALSQHEQALCELRSLLARLNAGVPPERLDALLNSSREQVLNHLEAFGRKVEVQIDLILSEAKQCITSSLASLNAENHPALKANRDDPGPRPGA